MFNLLIFNIFKGESIAFPFILGIFQYFFVYFRTALRREQRRVAGVAEKEAMKSLATMSEEEESRIARTNASKPAFPVVLPFRFFLRICC